MLGIYLLVCMAVYFLIALKAWSLVKGGSSSVVLSTEPRTYEVCRRAVKLRVASKIVILAGYLGCAWPYLFIEGIDRNTYFAYIAFLGLLPVLAVIYRCYSEIRDAQGTIRISTNEIEYKRHGSFTIKVSDIKEIAYSGMDKYMIRLKEKGKRTQQVDLDGFYKKEEIYSLMKQLRDYSAKATGRDRSLAHKLHCWMFQAVADKCAIVILCLLLLYTSYCCIDYDFFREDYTLRYNALGANVRQTENAWPHYVAAAANGVELEENLQKMIETNIDSSPRDFTDSQKEELKGWFSKNSASWASLKKATSVDYCNAAYEKISLMDKKGRRDFSNPSDGGYAQIRDIYGNVYAGLHSNVFELNWFDLFQMQLSSSRHFVNGKSFIDQLVGYALVRKTVNILAEQEHYEPEDLQNARVLLKERFPAGVPSLSIEGEILISCSSYDDMIRLIKIPIQTPLNPVFLMLGSNTGTEAYAKKHYTVILEQARKDIEFESKRPPIIGFPIMRKTLFDISDSSIVKIYQHSQKANTDLLAAYLVLDLEGYRLKKGSYPADVSQLKEAGFNSELPDDIDSGGKIIYRNDGQRAVLYAVGYNAIDDGGFQDERGSGDRRDDIVYWQRKLK
jgi:hypothetical protein